MDEGKVQPALFEPGIVRRAVSTPFQKLDPRRAAAQPGDVRGLRRAASSPPSWPSATPTASAGFILVSVWLWFTVLFANFAEAVAEGRGKAQADSLRKSKRAVKANRLAGTDRLGGRVTGRSGAELRKGDVVLVEAGDLIPGDGEVIEGVASVNESAITGESAPVIRESGGDRSAVTGGTRVLSDWLVVRISANPGESFLDRMIAMVEGAKRQKTPNEIALNILLARSRSSSCWPRPRCCPSRSSRDQAAGPGQRR